MASSISNSQPRGGSSLPTTRAAKGTTAIMARRVGRNSTEPCAVEFQPIQADSPEPDRAVHQYTVDATLLGQQCLYWADPQWQGFFSSTDIEGVIAIALIGAHRTQVHESFCRFDAIPFSTTPWDSAAAIRPAWADGEASEWQFPFSRKLLVNRSSRAARPVLQRTDSRELHRWLATRKRLPFWKPQLALPAGESAAT